MARIFAVPALKIACESAKMSFFMTCASLASNTTQKNDRSLLEIELRLGRNERLPPKTFTGSYPPIGKMDEILQVSNFETGKILSGS